MFSRLLEVARDCAGAAMVEFAIVLPLLITVLVGILQFAIYFYDYVEVEYAAAIGERQLLASRLTGNSSGADATPYSSTISAIDASTNLSSNSQFTITISVGGTPCDSDQACATALNTALSATTWPARTASVQVSYPCLTLLPASWAVSFCPSGVVQATYTQRVD